MLVILVRYAHFNKMNETFYHILEFVQSTYSHMTYVYAKKYLNMVELFLNK